MSSGESTDVPAGVPADDQSVWVEVLRGLGIDDETIERHRRLGPLEFLALECFLLQDIPRYQLGEVVERTGIEPARLQRFWRSMGFAEVHERDSLFCERDIQMFTAAISFIDGGGIDEDVALQMGRVLGSSLERIASAQIEAAQSRDGPTGLDITTLAAPDRADALEYFADLLPLMSNVMEVVWRRHLAGAARRRLASDSADTGEVAVGFADLEGFTSLSQQLPDDELAAVIGRFEDIAYDVVVAHGGRVVKMIGDEVMFAVDDVSEGAKIALELADRYATEPTLSDVRVGLAFGRALSLEGDLYGPVVNLASRIVAVADPGTVVVPAEVRDALIDDPGLAFRSIRPHYLRNIGRVRLWTLERKDEESETRLSDTLAKAKDRRAARRRWVAERMATKLADHAAGVAAEVAGDVTDRAVRRILEPRGRAEPLATESDTDQVGNDDAPT